MTKDSRQSVLSSVSEPDEITDLEDIDWTFKAADTKRYTHGLHKYPARMVPQIVDNLLSYYINEGVIEQGDLIYDPFSGSGTTSVEARIKGLNAEANDINPFAVMLSQAKAIPLDRKNLSDSRDYILENLSSELRDVREEYQEKGEVSWLELPDVRDGWFPQPHLYELSFLRDRIDEVEEEYGIDYARFWRIVLSHTTRIVSYDRNGEFKRYRIAEEDREDHAEDVSVEEEFTDKVKENYELMLKYIQVADYSVDTTIHYSDSRFAVDDVGENSADIVITSPPYGDHGTTVAYGQFSQDPALLTGKVDYDEMRNVDKRGLGGKNEVVEPLSDLEEYSPALKETLETLREKEGRSDDALNFFTDYFEVMKEVAKITKPGQPVAWVVANRTMSRVNIPTHLITIELCEHLGYEFDVNLPREIPNKTMPLSNAPENVTGDTGELMSNENIVILRAPDTN